MEDWVGSGSANDFVKLCGAEEGLEKYWREKVGMCTGLVGSQVPGWLGCRPLRGARFEILTEESVAEGAVTNMEGLGEFLAPLATEKPGTSTEDSGGKNEKDVGDGDEDRGNADKEGGE